MVEMADRQTTTISESIIAYSTAVGPSSAARNRRNLTKMEFIFRLQSCKLLERLFLWYGRYGPPPALPVLLFPLSPFSLSSRRRHSIFISSQSRYPTSDATEQFITTNLERTPTVRRTPVIFPIALLLLLTAANAEDPIAKSVVKIHSTIRQPDYVRPWNKGNAQEASGSGFILNGKRILTNAHVVNYASQILCRRTKRPTACRPRWRPSRR